MIENMVSNTACVIAGCSSSRKNVPDLCFFFHLEVEVNGYQKVIVSQWLSKSNRNGLSVCQLPEKNSTVHIGGQHFINGKPSVLFDTTGPNWIPTLMLDYKSVAIFSPESASVQNDQRKRRWEKKNI